MTSQARQNKHAKYVNGNIISSAELLFPYPPPSPTPEDDDKIGYYTKPRGYIINIPYIVAVDV